MSDTVFPFPGGKAVYAGWVVSALPSHGLYVEPFGGAAAVLLNKEPSNSEVYNDIDGDLCHFFRVLRDDGEELRDYMRNVEFSTDLYEKWTRRWYEGWRPADDVKRAAIFYFSRYAQWGGKYEGVSGFARSTPNRNTARSLVNKVEMLTEFQDRLNESAGDWPVEFVESRNRYRRVMIENMDYRELFETYDVDNSDGEGTVFYCDPPYMDTEHRYADDGFDHEAFIDALEALEGDWLVSYGTKVPERLKSYRMETATATRGIDRVSSDGKKATEHLIKSYPESRERSFEITGNAESVHTSDWCNNE